MAKQIPLTKGKFAIVDDEDYEELSKYKWQADLSYNKWYAVTHIWTGEYKTNAKGWRIKVRKKTRMHRLINNTPSGFDTDHINGDTLDNRKSNLRTVTNTQNQLNKDKKSNNTSGYKNVFLNKRSGKYLAKLQINGIQKSFGEYDTAEKAYYAVCLKMIELHGEYLFKGIKEWVSEFENKYSDIIDEIKQEVYLKFSGGKSNNSTGFAGVYFNKELGKYFTKIKIDGKYKSMFYSDNPEETYKKRIEYLNR